LGGKDGNKISTWVSTWVSFFSPMISNAQYSHYVSFANKLRKHHSVLTEDIVNDALLGLLELNTEPTKKNIEQAIANLCKASFSDLAVSSLAAQSSFLKLHDADKYCKKCKEVKPLGGFYKWLLNSGKIRIDCMCCECRSKTHKIWWAKTFVSKKKPTPKHKLPLSEDERTQNFRLAKSIIDSMRPA
jgi:hypothetical protein